MGDLGKGLALTFIHRDKWKNKLTQQLVLYKYNSLYILYVIEKRTNVSIRKHFQFEFLIKGRNSAVRKSLNICFSSENRHFFQRVSPGFLVENDQILKSVGVPCLCP